MVLALFTKTGNSSVLNIEKSKQKRAEMTRIQKEVSSTPRPGSTPFEIYEDAVRRNTNPPCLYCGHRKTRKHGQTPGGQRYFCAEGCGQTFSRKTAVEMTVARPTCSVCGTDSKKVKNGTPIKSGGEIVQNWRCNQCGSTTELPVLDLGLLAQIL